MKILAGYFIFWHPLFYCSRQSLSQKNLILLLLLFSLRSYAQISKDSCDMFLNQGILSYKQRDFDTSVYYFNRVLICDPGSDQAYFRRALVMEKFDDIATANEDYSKAIEINPKPLYYNNRGLNKALKGYFEQAIDDYDRAIQLDSTYIQSWMNRGIAYKQIGRLDIACENVNKAHELGYQFAKEFLDRYCK